MTHPADTGTNWPEDAAAFERAYGPDFWDDHRPTRAELARDEWCDLRFDEFRCSRPEGHSGACYDQENDAAFEDGHFIPNDFGHVSTVSFLLFIIAGSLVFLALLAGGQHVMCGQDSTIAYCTEAGL